MEEYVEALAREAEFYAAEQVDSVFIGGGTPSCLRDGAIAKLMDGVQKSISIAPGAEISIEANPNSLTQKKAREYRAAGINRLSIGLQAVQDSLLKSIGGCIPMEIFSLRWKPLWQQGFPTSMWI